MIFSLKTQQRSVGATRIHHSDANKIALRLRVSAAEKLIVEFDHLEVGPVKLTQLLQIIIVPPVIRCTGDVEIAADVGQDQPVLLHGF